MIKARKSIFVSIFCSLLFVLRVKATTTTKKQRSSEKEREREQSSKARHNKNACGRCCVDEARGQILPTESHFQPAAAEGEGGREGGLCWPTDWSCARDCCLKTAQNGAHISKRLSGMPDPFRPCGHG